MIDNGWLDGARCVPSPNFDARPCGDTVSLLVIHNISLPPEQFSNGYIEQFFCNQLDPRQHPYFMTIADLRVSSHMLITREGEMVQFVGFGQRAWHAGVSCFEGRERCNDFSIGVELEGADTIPYSDAQYMALAELTNILQRQYPEIIANNIVGHCDIAPGRKTDPGSAFDWPRFRTLLNNNINAF